MGRPWRRLRTRERTLRTKGAILPTPPGIPTRGKAPSRPRSETAPRHGAVAALAALAALQALSRMPLPISSPEMARSAAAPKEPASYEQALAELDRLVEQMEAGQLPLDQLLDGYRRGAELLAWCRARLQAVEEQVKVLEDGQLKPWTSA